MASLLNIGTRSLAAAQGQLTTISHNIANANTAGYSRQEAILTTSSGEMTGAGFFGRGVDITSVQRRYDQFLTSAAQATGSQAAADAARSDALSQLDAVFGDSDLGVGAALDNLFSATGDLANRPTDSATRQAFLARADQFAQRVTSVGTQLVDLQSMTDSQLSASVKQVNDRLSEIRHLNEEIARLSTSGQPPNDLLDQRNQAIQSLGQMMAVRTVEADDGSLNLFTPSGAQLLVGSHQSVLRAATDPAQPDRVSLQLDMGGSATQWMDAASLGGGRLAGLLQFRDQDLAAARSQLGALAQSVANGFNTQHALGVDAGGQPGTALFDVSTDTAGRVVGLTARSLSAAQLATGYAAVPEAGAANTGGARVAAFSIARTTTDSALPVTITFNNPPTTFNVTGLAGGNLANVPYTPGMSIPAAPSDYNGWRLTLQGAAAAGDTFEVKPNASPRADNRNALALGALARQRDASGVTFNEAYASLVADVGNRVQGGREMASVSAAMHDEATSRLASASGVNLDEEAADLLRFQQAYQASAKVIQASQTLFDALMAATRG